MLVMVFRTLILYVAVLVIIRIMGKRELGQLQPFEFVVAILIADLVSIPMTNTGVPIFYGIIPVVSLLIAHLAISQLSLTSTVFRKMICGSPSIIITNGVINESMMHKLRYNLDDLFEQLRENDVFTIEDVEYAILETSGRLSLILKGYKRSLVPRDIKAEDGEVWVPRNIIIDGVVDKEELYLSGLSFNDLADKVKNYGYPKINDVFLCTTKPNNELYIQGKSNIRIRKRK